MKQIWYIVDAEGKVPGRIATTIADKLRGKDKVSFTPHLDCGDFVIVINCEKIKLTGNKLLGKEYYTHSGYIGNLKTKTSEDMLAKTPEKIIELAVKGMLPKNKMRKEFLKKLKVYAGSEHPHAAQQPQPLEIK